MSDPFTKPRRLMEQAEYRRIMGRVAEVTGLTVVADGLPVPVGFLCEIERTHAEPIAAQVVGVRGAACHDELTAQISRRHNDANVLCLAADVLGEDLVRRIVRSWLETEFEDGGRHSRRVAKIKCIEQGQDPSTCDLAKHKSKRRKS